MFMYLKKISIMYIILVSYDYFQELNNKIRNKN